MGWGGVACGVRAISPISGWVAQRGLPPGRLQPVRACQQPQRALVARAAALHRQALGRAQQPGGPQAGVGGLGGAGSRRWQPTTLPLRGDIPEMRLVWRRRAL